MEKKEAIKILKDFHDKSALFSVRTALETLHPELKESEDERIRKEIIAWLKNSEGQTLPIDRYNAALAWLEKQGEQKPQRMISAEAKEALYDKPAWSEDDEKMLVDAYVMLDWYKGNNWWTARRIKDWLNSLKERIGG